MSMRQRLPIGPQQAFPALPLELILIIFKFAAADSKNECLTLCRVSSWSNQLLQSTLHSVVELRSERQRFTFRRHIINWRPGSIDVLKLASIVQHISFPTSNLPTNSHANIFCLCMNLWDIALTTSALLALVNYVREHDLPKWRIQRGGLHLTMFGPSPEWEVIIDLSRAEPRSPLFAMVTHIRINNLLRMTLEHVVFPFPNITHAAIPFKHSIRVAAAWYRFYTKSLTEDLPPQLEMGVLMIQSAELIGTADFASWIRDIRKAEPRIYFLATNSDDLEDHWRTEARGGQTLWATAVEETLRWESEHSTSQGDRP
ncbi:hypothetical protein PLICRDRAFT_36446 [Plicaturopsis crispa FD-325 SS-3]|nr:hypothetical protein PLICRDRAFT_36446 [Plicaturopsis crispa FD-325 SS-3]